MDIAENGLMNLDLETIAIAPETLSVGDETAHDISCSVLKTPTKKNARGTQESPSKVRKKPNQSQKSSKKSLKTPTKRQEFKSTSVKRQKPEDISSDEPKLKSQKLQGQKSNSQETILENEVEDCYIDESLERKATKVKMSAKNVKSVIHHVLTNEHVLTMFKDALESEMEDLSGKQSSSQKNSTSHKLDCVPKMTRAKVKDFLEKICMPSPVKIVKDGLSILDVEFNEEEEDDEYNPERDEECNDSDEESVTSSRLSEFGSPYPPTPTTPCVRSATDILLPPSTNDFTITTSASSTSAKNLDTAFSTCAGPSNQEDLYGVDTIALRTRSKLPLTSTSITEIESALVAPDITADMYDTNCEDVEWVQFLSSLYKLSADDTITDDDADANDPEFNYMAEAEREKPDEEDFRFDKPAQITKKEMNALINELNDLFEDEVLPYQVVASVPEGINLPIFKSGSEEVATADTPNISFNDFKTPDGVPLCPAVQLGNSEMSMVHQEQDQGEQQHILLAESNINSVRAIDDCVTPEQRALIEDNMRKHIQLLCQNHLLFQTTIERLENLTSPKQLIIELDYLRQASLAGSHSVFNVCNLDAALEFVSDSTLCESNKTQKAPLNDWWNGTNSQDSPHLLTFAQKLAIYASPAFVYPTLLPSLKKVKGERKYMKFLPNEDNLIALGLEQFQYCRNVSPVQLIYKYLIRGKNVGQIFSRIRFMSSSKCGDNAIKCVKKNGKLPEYFPKPSLDRFYPRAPKDQIPELLPTWCHHMKEKKTKKSSSQTKALDQVSVQSTSKGQHQVSSTPVSGQPPVLSNAGNVLQASIPISSSAGGQMTVQSSANSQLPMFNGAEKVMFSGVVMGSSQVGNALQVCTPSIVSWSAGAHSTQQHRQSTEKRTSVSVQSGSLDQILPTCTIPQVVRTNQTSQALLLQKNLPITGIYIQFGTPMPAPQPMLPVGKNLPMIAPNVAATVRSIAPKTSSGPTKRGKKNKMSLSSKSVKHAVVVSPSILKKGSQHFPKECGHTGVSTSSTQTEGSLTLDVLAQTMKSCGIEESPLPQPPDSPTMCSTPLPGKRAKHSSVRNLNPAFDAEAQSSVSDSSDARNSEEGSSSIGKSLAFPNKSVTRNKSMLVHESQENGTGTNIVLSPPTIHETDSETDGGNQQTQLPTNLQTESSTDIDALSPKTGTDNEKQTPSRLNLKAGNKLDHLFSTSQPSTDYVSGAGQTDSYHRSRSLTHREEAEISVDTKGLQAVGLGKESLFSSTNVPDSETHSQIKSLMDDNVGKENSALSLTQSSESQTSQVREYALINPCYENPTRPKTIKELLDANKKSHLSENTHTNVQSAFLDFSVKSVTPREAGELGNDKPTSEETSLSPFSCTSLSGEENNLFSASVKTMAFLPSINAMAVVTIPSPIKALDSTCKQPSPMKTPSKNRPLVPKALSPAQALSPSYFTLPKISPKRKELQKQVRQILPKTFVFEVKSPSPTKAVAMVLKKKATMVCQHRSPIKILPKQPQSSPGAVRPRSVLAPFRKLTRSQRTKNKPPDKKARNEKADPIAENRAQDKEKDTAERDVNEVEDIWLSQEEDEEEDFESEDRSQLDDLMAACTTIGYEPRKGSNFDGDIKSKAQKKREICLSLLEADILDRDPKKDERDTAYAQHYFSQVKHVLREDPERFKKFLTLLRDLNRDHSNPIELYADMATLLSDHQDLVDDFAGFLLSFQAVECECFVSSLEYQQIRSFLRQLEIYCDTSSLTFHRTLKMMSKWLTLNQEAQSDTTPYKDRIGAVLRHVPDVMEDLLSYFFDGSLPDSHLADFEEVDMEEQEMLYVDEFEEVTLPERREDYNTKSCSCQCHDDPHDEKYRRRIRHCFSCSLMMFEGKPVLKVTRNEYRPVTVVYPMEEKEKMMKAKKEAAQLALAKARAQRQQKKKKNHKSKRERGKLKCKGSKRLSLKKKKQLSSDSSQQENTVNRTMQEAESPVSKNVGPSEGVACENVDFHCVMRQVDKPGASDKMGCDSVVVVSTCLTDVSQGSPGNKKESEQKPCDTVNAVCINASQSALPSSPITSSQELHIPDKGPEMTSGTKCAIVLSGESVCEAAYTSAVSTSESRAVVSASFSVPLSVHGLSSSAQLASAHVTVGTLTSSTGTSLHTNGTEFIGADSRALSTRQTKKTHLGSSLTQLLSAPVQVFPASLMHTGLTAGRPVVSASQPCSLSPAISSNSCISEPALTTISSSLSNLASPVLVSAGKPYVAAHSDTGPLPALPSPFQAAPLRIPVIVSLAPQKFLPSFTPSVRASSQRASTVKSQIASVHGSDFHKSSAQNLEGREDRMEISPEKNESRMTDEQDIRCVTSTASFSDPPMQESNLSGSLVSASQVIECEMNSTGFSNSTTMKIQPENGTVASNTSKLTSNMVSGVASWQNMSRSCSVAEPNRTLTATPCEHLFLSPVKTMRGKIPESAHVDKFSLSGFDDTLGLTSIQHLAQSVSPNKSVSQFDLLAFIDSSNLTWRDAGGQSRIRASSPKTTSDSLLSFSGAISKASATVSDPAAGTDAGATVPVVCKEMDAIGTSCDPVKKLSQNVKASREGKLSTQPALSSIFQDDDNSNSFDTWNEELDRSILNVVADEGITESSMKKLQSCLPRKSVDELKSRAEQLLTLLQDMEESDPGTDASRDSFN